MSDLLPNLDALLAELVGATAAQRDARALVEAIGSVSTEAELDAALTETVTRWRQE